jgi:uncharacterized damage-inducible protein DinB
VATEPTPDLRYPTGRFHRPASLTPEERREAIEAIAATPAALREAIAGLSEEQLDTPYRPGGWTVRQVVHHVPESHMNAYVRFKLGLTEETPTIRPYHEDRWSEQPEVRSAPPELSLRLLEALHERWVLALRAIPEEGFARTIDHPDMGRLTLDTLLAMYAWHGRHHVAHVTELRRRMGW